MADIYSLTIKADTRDVTRAKQALDGLANGSLKAKRATEGVTSEYLSLKRSINPAYAAQQDFNRSLGILQRELKQGNITLGQYNADLSVLRQRARVAGTGGFRPMGNAVQAAGFQIGDFATQVASGQSALVAFAQQGSQLAGLFGPGGAVLGAVIAIGGAIAGGLVRAFSEGGEEARTLAERISEVAESTDDLTEAQIRAIKADFFADNRERLANIQKERERIAELNRQIEENNDLINNPRARALRGRGGVVSQSVEELRAANQRYREEIDTTQASIDTYFQNADRLSQELNDLIFGTDETAEAQEKATKQAQQLAEQLLVQAETIGLNNEQLVQYEINRLAANGADAETIRLLREQAAATAEVMREEEARELLRQRTMITPEDDPLLQRIEAEKRGQEILLQQQKNYATARNRIDQQMLSQSAATTSALAGTVADLAGEQSNAYRAAFLAQQAFAIASAIVNTQMAAAAALAPPPIGLGPVAGAPYAGYIEALGAANVAIIAAQTVAGLANTYGGERALGGSVSGGSSYLVGERGPEIVTMGGSGVVTPSAQMNAANDSGDVIVNINNAPQGTRTETRTDDQGNRFVDVFVADMASGGPMSRSIQNTYGVRRQGR